MITRTAIFEGHIKPGHEQKFYDDIERRLAPLWVKFPHALAVRWCRVQSSDEGSPPIALIQQVDYPSLEALEAAMASPERAAARAMTQEILSAFEGRFYHVVSEGHIVQGS
ncbi:MAG: hypothetical protein ABW136_10810 [Steroidobacteraceae bacterium]